MLGFAIVLLISAPSGRHLKGQWKSWLSCRDTLGPDRTGERDLSDRGLRMQQKTAVQRTLLRGLR